MSDISSISSARTPQLRLVRYDSAPQVQVADDREQQLSAQLEARISSQLGQIRQRLVTAGASQYGRSDQQPGSLLDVLA